MSQALAELLGFCCLIAAFIAFAWYINRDAFISRKGRSKK